MFGSIKWRIAIPYILLILVGMSILGFYLADTGIDRSIVVLAMGLATLFSILVALFIARAITRPIKAVTQAAKRITSGEMDQKIHVATGDESAELAHAFNEMTEGFREMMGALSTERNRLAAVLSTMADGVLMADAEGNVLMVNPAAERLFGFEEKAAIGHPLIEAVPDHEISDMLQSCLRSGQQQSGQIEQSSGGRLLRVIATRVHGSRFTVDGLGRPLNGEPWNLEPVTGGALLIFQDLTEVRRFQTMRQEFVGNISHELRTPLASMKAVLETLNEGAIDDRQIAKDFLAMMGGEVDRMTQLVRELAELSRIETGQNELEIAPVDLNSLIDQAVTKLKPQSERKQIDILRQSDPALPVIPAEEERIEQVLTNLLHNAIKFTPASGKIIISAKSEDDGVLVAVEDTGAGIPAEDLPHVFERFYKADKARSSEGTGLGLAIAKHIIQAHEGNIWARSEEGRGSTFSFRLPTRRG
ncbi:cell wall metabolism sensor histidine kinase WalK [Dehalococcoidia bacterium]|nr:cell wall metabolism sensor histidine kinase WalK [Dehalococcoidia bacterium]